MKVWRVSNTELGAREREPSIGRPPRVTRETAGSRCWPRPSRGIDFHGLHLIPPEVPKPIGRESTPPGASAEPHNPLKGGRIEHMGCAKDTLAAGVETSQI